MSDREPRVTVVMITHNRRDEVLRTLEHMVALPDAAPIIVVDNASDDGTATAISDRYPQVELIAADHNLGAVGRNVAIERVRTPYVSFCDDDTRWQAGSLTRAVEVLEGNPGLASVTGRCLVARDGSEDPLTPELRYSPVPGPPWLPGPALLGIMAGLTTMRVSAFRQVGGFCERMWLGGEEELLALDLAAAGWWMCWCEDIVIVHEASRARDSRHRRRLGIRNTLWTLWLRRPLRSALRRSFAIVGSAPKDAATLGAVTDALRGALWVARHRQVVPDRVEYGLVLLEEDQKRSPARRYIG